MCDENQEKLSKIHLYYVELFRSFRFMDSLGLIYCFFFIIHKCFRD